MSNNADAQIRGYLAADYKTTTFNIGRAVDTGPGDVGRELVNPSGGGIPTGNPGFPRGSRVAYTNHKTHKRIDVILEGANEKKERVGAFYITAVDTNDKSVQITAIKRASGGNCSRILLIHSFNSFSNFICIEANYQRTSLRELKIRRKNGKLVVKRAFKLPHNQYNQNK